jgi:hypothetical protein
LVAPQSGQRRAAFTGDPWELVESATIEASITGVNPTRRSLESIDQLERAVVGRRAVCYLAGQKSFDGCHTSTDSF